MFGAAAVNLRYSGFAFKKTLSLRLIAAPDSSHQAKGKPVWLCKIYEFLYIFLITALPSGNTKWLTLLSFPPFFPYNNSVRFVRLKLTQQASRAEWGQRLYQFRVQHFNHCIRMTPITPRKVLSGHEFIILLISDLINL